MPEKERTQGKIIAYLTPTVEVEAEARRAHRDWLASNPNTKRETIGLGLWGFGPMGRMRKTTSLYGHPYRKALHKPRRL
jgi:hypothetical protein